MSVIVMTAIGDVPRQWLPAGDDFFPAPPGFCWRFVPEGRLAVQFRSILRMDAGAVVVWVGAGDAIDRAVELINQLCGRSRAIVIAVAEAHDRLIESRLRQTGAIYLCGGEAHERLGDVLAELLGSMFPTGPAG